LFHTKVSRNNHTAAGNMGSEDHSQLVTTGLQMRIGHLQKKLLLVQRFCFMYLRNALEYSQALFFWRWQ